MLMKLIDKDALVAEIKRRIKTNKECMLGLRNLDYYQGKVDALNDTISFLDTSKVRDVDLEKEYKEYVEEDPVYNKLVNGIVGKSIAKHFFELGIKAKGE